VSYTQRNAWTRSDTLIAISVAEIAFIMFFLVVVLSFYLTGEVIDTEREIAAIQRDRDNAVSQAADLESENSELQDRIRILVGTDMRSCTGTDARGYPSFAFDIYIYPEYYVVQERADLQRARQNPGQNDIPDTIPYGFPKGSLSQTVFIDRSQHVFEWSKKQKCRFRAYIHRRMPRGNEYKARAFDIREYFYASEARK